MPTKLDELTIQLGEMQEIENKLRILILASSQTAKSMSPILELVTPILDNLKETRDWMGSELQKDLPDNDIMLVKTTEAIAYHRTWIEQLENSLDNIESAIKFYESSKGKNIMPYKKPSYGISRLPEKPALPNELAEEIEKQKDFANGVLTVGFFAVASVKFGVEAGLKANIIPGQSYLPGVDNPVARAAYSDAITFIGFTAATAFIGSNLLGQNLKGSATVGAKTAIGFIIACEAIRLACQQAKKGYVAAKEWSNSPSPRK